MKSIKKQSKTIFGKTLPKLITTILFLALLTSCNKDDDADNLARVGIVELQFPANEETLIYTQPKFEWNAFETDKTITYTVLTGTEMNNLSKLKPDINEIFTTVEDDERFETATTYYWKVQAFENDKLVAESTTQMFTTETISPKLIADNAAFNKRKAAGVAVFKDKIWVIGGKNEADEGLNDIWSSTDGINWASEGVFPFEPIYAHKLIAFKNKLWVFGGVHSSFTNRAIYSSEDGVNWVKENEVFPISQYSAINMINYKDKLYRLGGYNGNSGNNTNERYVYSSTDGLNWILETESNGFTSKYSFKVTVFNDRIYGFDFKHNTTPTNIKASNDGVNWEEAGSYGSKTNAFLAFFTLNDKLILYNTALKADKPDVYFEETTDGVNWQAAHSKESTAIRVSIINNYEIVYLKDVIYAIGGVGNTNNNTTNNDVWKLN